ncbi:hypothetical protein LMG22037_06464 [Paraburkholderia phenoliruptrix]|uniref:Uncharacterized protein n=1 Tax=Paraburkholderia phenoliruptrix TaxID=252970 RepID=A0A6J5CQF4_9BURK|nr:hypothetical protein LMG22037_06464 [Paraburkholderia phenoliruptrix]
MSFLLFGIAIIAMLCEYPYLALVAILASCAAA